MSQWPPSTQIFTDGASRGNPGPASIGIVVYDQDKNIVAEHKEKLGTQTNNYAEYMAVVRAMEIAIEAGGRDIDFYCDSQLLVRQMNREYKIKSPQIKELFDQCQNLLGKLGKVTFNHVRREQNKEADALANEALDF